MFGLISAIIFSNFNLSNVNSLECFLMNNQKCKIRSEIFNVSNNEYLFYPYFILCNRINDPYAKLCVANNIKNMNVKVFNLVSRTNETRHIKRHKTCICKCRLDASVCNNKQRWNENKCRCECKELIDNEMCDKELFGIVIIVSVNVINHVMLENI